MRAHSAVQVPSSIAIEAKHAVAGRVASFFQPSVNIRSHLSIPAMAISAAVYVIYREKRKDGLAATYTNSTAVGLKR
jgi:hypothetical protein